MTYIDPLELLGTRALRIAKMLRISRLPFFTGSIHPFTDYFKGFEKVEAVRRLFGERTEEVLGNLKIELTAIGGYMWVSNVDGHLVVSSRYLGSGDRVDVFPLKVPMNGALGFVPIGARPAPLFQFVVTDASMSFCTM